MLPIDTKYHALRSKRQAEIWYKHGLLTKEQYDKAMIKINEKLNNEKEDN
jgi:uncharacterized protein YqgQ